MNNLKKISKIIYNFVVVLLIVIAVFSAASVLDIPGGVKMYVVESGSMEPVIMTKSVVFVRQFEKYQKEDIITFADANNETVTHRIIGVNTDQETTFTTKGDANDVPDGVEVPSGSVKGKVILSVPYLGYPIAFAKTQTGLIALVVIPATIIIYSELMTIKNEAIRLLRERKKRKLSLIENAEVAVGMEVMEVQDEIKSTEEKIERKLFKKKNNKKK
ncbi:signal peptidase I [Candidatus Roizmanbacteria bacterium]|nr:MAG: signal peptidase I [Candidatus Roizmanbacteria bacterium]